METAIYLLTISLIVGTVLIVFGMKYVSAAFAARARIATDEAYRTLADKAVASQSGTRPRSPPFRPRSRESRQVSRRSRRS